MRISTATTHEIKKNIEFTDKKSIKNFSLSFSELIYITQLLKKKFFVCLKIECTSHTHTHNIHNITLHCIIPLKNYTINFHRIT